MDTEQKPPLLNTPDSNDDLGPHLHEDWKLYAFILVFGPIAWLLVEYVYRQFGVEAGWAVGVMAALYAAQTVMLVPAFTGRVVVNNLTGTRRGIGNGWQFILPPPFETVDVESDTDIQTLGHSFKTILETGRKKDDKQGGETEREEDKEKYEPVELTIGVTDTPSVAYLDRFRMIQKKEDRQKEVDKYITSFLTSIQSEYENRADVMGKVGLIATQIRDYIKQDFLDKGLSLDHFFGLDITNISVDVELPEELKKAGIEREAVNQRNMAQTAKTRNQEERARDLVNAATDKSLLFKEALQFVMMADGSNIKKEIQEKKFDIGVTTLNTIMAALEKVRPVSPWNPESLHTLKEIIKEVGNVIKKDE